MTDYDLIVIGSGAGLKVAFSAALKGLKTLLVEKENLGGTCLNKGCIPSKMFIAPADFIDSFQRLPGMNITASAPKADFTAIANRTFNTIIKTRDHIKKRILKLPDLTLLSEQVAFTDNKQLSTSKGLIKAEKIVIATGMKSKIPLIPGLSNTPYLTSTEVLKLKKLPSSLLILGGGYIACEMAHYLSSYGVDVTLMVRSKVLRKEDQETVTLFKSELGKKIKLMEGALPEKINFHDNRFIVTLHNREYSFDQLVSATGQIPETESLHLASTSVDTDDNGFIITDKNLKTSNEGIYAIGDCIGHYFFRHSANFQAEYLIDHLFNNKTAPIKYPPMPHAVFSDPEIAAVGYSEEELQEKKIPYICGKSFFKDANMGLARAYQQGLIKILISPETRLFLGVHITGEDAATLIHSFVMAMTFNHTIDNFLEVIFIHPAMTEALKEAVQDARSKLKYDN